MMIRRFAQHRVAANLLVALVFILGFMALMRLNTQFLPNFNVDMVTVTTVWPGGGPADIERAITTPIENELQDLAGVKKLASTSSRGQSQIIIEFFDGTDMSVAVQQIKNRVDQVRNLPRDARKPQVTKVEPFERVAEVVLAAKGDVNALKPWAEKFKRELLKRGIAKVSIKGAPETELSLTLSPEQLVALDMDLPTLAAKVAKQSQDVSAGVVGRRHGGAQLRNVGQLRAAHDYQQLPIVSGDVDLLFRLGDVASVVQTEREYTAKTFYHGQPAIVLTLFRTPKMDALKTAKILDNWLAEVQPKLPQGMQVKPFNEAWQLIKERIMLLVKNGLGGLLLIFILLFWFLNTRVALWVALGIPIAIFTTFIVMSLLGLSINMVSMFGLLMALGIIVDDTIVVAEEGVSEFARSADPLQAAVAGAKRMLVPVFAASLTTVAAFAPLLFLGGIYGKILFDIPLVVICVILASLFEAFLVLPSHLRSSFVAIQKQTLPKYRQRLEAGFAKLRDQHFYRLVRWAVGHRLLVLVMVLGLLAITVACVMTGRPGFSFFPTPDGKTLLADVMFVPGTSSEKIQQAMLGIERAALMAEQKVAPGEKLIAHLLRFNHLASGRFDSRPKAQLASLLVELVPAEQRDVSNADFIAAWRQVVPAFPWVESMELRSRRGGPQGKAIDIALTGGSAETLKQAALVLAAALRQFQGAYNVTDNLPYAPAEYVFHLRPEAHGLGMTVEDIGRQLRAAYAGDLVQVFYQGNEEVEVRLRLDRQVREQMKSLVTLPIRTPAGVVVPLHSLCRIERRKHFSVLLHTDHALAVHVSAEVDSDVANANQIVAALKANTLPQLMARFGVEAEFKGKVADQQRTLAEMKWALIFALAVIYIVLAWVSASYVWPLLVMLAIPMGLMGAIWGHLLLGMSITLLSLFGFFGLTGIVINDSIILLLKYKALREEGVVVREAIVTASCQRFRPVILTSVTTIAGLLPILFETSLQAQFLIPMATAICFGLAVATLLILIVIPTLLAWVDDR